MAIKAEQRWAIWGMAGGYCGICGEPVPYRQMHLDHITPVSLGGETVIGNLRPAHAACNIGRGNGHVPRTTPRPVGPNGILIPKLIRFPKDVEDAIESAAREGRRSFTQQVLLIVEEYRREC